MMESSELLSMWGRAMLNESGYAVGDDDGIYFDLTTVGDGCCSECYSESAVITINSGKFSITVSSLW